MTLDEQLQFALALEHPSAIIQHKMVYTPSVHRTFGTTKHVGGQFAWQVAQKTAKNHTPTQVGGGWGGSSPKYEDGDEPFTPFTWFTSTK